jgi:membrane associated rhomboid family serine protease
MTSALNEWATHPEWSARYIESANNLYESTILHHLNIPTIGASGAVFGLLLAFGMLFPNTELMLMFIPVPIKAKYFVIGYGAIELFFGLQNQAGDNVAHFAHLGGMLFGFFIVRYWRKHGKRFY